MNTQTALSGVLPEGNHRSFLYIILLLRRLVFGVEYVTRVKRFSQQQNFDLKDLGGKLGVRGFTLRNIGGHIIYVSTSSLDEKEPVYPGEHFAISGEGRCVDQSIKIIFDDNAYAENNTPFSGKNAIVRYKVDVC